MDKENDGSTWSQKFRSYQWSSGKTGFLRRAASFISKWLASYSAGSDMQQGKVPVALPDRSHGDSLAEIKNAMQYYKTFIAFTKDILDFAWKISPLLIRPC